MATDDAVDNVSRVMSLLPLGIERMVHGVESARLELKATWDKERIGPAVLRTICAFANDLHNLNGGYIVLGIDEKDGSPVRPVRGLTLAQVETAQQWIQGNCKRLLPEYMPVLSPEELDDEHVLVVWASASNVRPHQAPSGKGDKKYYVRIGSSTCEAQGDTLRKLISLTSRVPFDDRMNRQATMADVRESLVREFLRDVGSRLAEEDNPNVLYDGLKLRDRVNGHHAPKNVALLFFANDPSAWCRGAQIDVVQFGRDDGSDVLDERVFHGPLSHQLRQCLTYLDNLITRHITKPPGQFTAKHWTSYPIRAVREAVINAVYHRDYSSEHVDPIKVYIYPSHMDIISYPGPLEGIARASFEQGATFPRASARNRRVGELLKDLQLVETRGSGIGLIHRVMQENGSPPPRFDFDEGRTYFCATLPVHPPDPANANTSNALRSPSNAEYRSLNGTEALAAFKAGMRLLNDDKNISEKLAGIYLLAQLAKDFEDYNATVFHILMSFVREQSKQDNSDGSDPSMVTQIPADVAVALKALVYRDWALDTNISLDGVVLRGAQLAHAQLSHAHLFGIELYETDLQHADLRSARLEDAVLVHVNLSGADLRRAHLVAADFRDCNLDGAFFRGAVYSKGHSVMTDTHFPDGFDPLAHGMQLLRA